MDMHSTACTHNRSQRQRECARARTHARTHALVDQAQPRRHLARPCNSPFPSPRRSCSRISCRQRGNTAASHHQLKRRALALEHRVRGPRHSRNVAVAVDGVQAAFGRMPGDAAAKINEGMKTKPSTTNIPAAKLRKDGVEEGAARQDAGALLQQMRSHTLGASDTALHIERGYVLGQPQLDVGAEVGQQALKFQCWRLVGGTRELGGGWGGGGRRALFGHFLMWREKEEGQPTIRWRGLSQGRGWWVRAAAAAALLLLLQLGRPSPPPPSGSFILDFFGSILPL